MAHPFLILPGNRLERAASEIEERHGIQGRRACHWDGTGTTLMLDEWSGSTIESLKPGCHPVDHGGVHESRSLAEGTFRSLVERIPAVTYVAALDGASTTLYVSPQVETYLGYSQEEYRRDPDIWRKIIHPDDRNRVMSELAVCHERGDPFFSEYRMVARDGRVLWFSDDAAVVRDCAGRPQYLQGVMLDITDRKRWEEAQRESREKYQSILENVGIGIALVSRELEILEANRKMREWFPAMNPGERPLCYHAFNDPPKSAACPYCPTVKTLQDGEVHEAVTQTPKGGARHAHYRIVSSPVRDAQGTVIAAIEMVEDITQQRRLEEQLRHSQKMEALGTFAGGIAHDFNNILFAIIGYAEMAMEEAPEEGALRGRLESILNASRRASDLVQRILTFGWQDAADPRPVRIIPLIDETLKMLEVSLPARVEICRRFEARSATVVAEPTQIHRILMNLCVNALHAMEERGGVLLIALKEVEVGEVAPHPDLKPGSYLRLDVSDTGCGMTPDVMRRVFDPGFTTKAPGVGSGMGLAVVHGMARSLGGAVTVESEVGTGAVFSVFLPERKGV
ncbi:MAG: PAS domain S-box protein [Planctomycetota bacterium]